jgi:urease accessory protein
MRRARALRREGDWNPANAIDRVVLDTSDRQRRRIVLTGERGTTFLLDLEAPVTMRDGDGLVLDDGSVVRVAGQSEPVAEINAPNSLTFVRIAWHLGNRHADVQFANGKLRIRRDHVLEQMVTGLGAAIVLIEAPFEPEPVVAGHGHGHAPSHGG